MNIKYPRTDNPSADSMSTFQSTISRDDVGFLSYLDQANNGAEAKQIFEKHKDKKHFVQIGIGGSALGPQMLLSALQKDFSRTFTFIDNTDADYIQRELSKINLKDSLFYVVSKSGGTAETIAGYIIIRNELINLGVQKEELGNYFVFCTDSKNGELREHVKLNNYDSLSVPLNVGGRFSVLTDVGLLPALFGGIDIDNLLNSAKSQAEKIKDIKNNEVLNLANYLFKLSERDVNQTVLMPYSSLLKDFSAWFVQLWGESLGKEGKGLTPLPAYGATDQHSQMQLFMEGPNDKVLILLNIKNSNHNFSLESDLNLAAANKLNSFNLNQLINAQFNGTCEALTQKNKNLITLEIEKLNEKTLGELIVFFESLTVAVGQYLNINPFDQPGVELGKKLSFKYLNSL